MGELCSIKSGKSDTKDAVEGGPYAFFDRSRTVKQSDHYLYDCEALIIPGEGAEFLPKHFVGKFDLHQRAYALFDFSHRIEVRFLYYFLIYMRDYFPRVAVGATVKSLRLRHFQQLPVSLPTLPEQRRIVENLDKAFAAINTARANTEINLQNARDLFTSELREVFARSWTTFPLVPLSDLATDITDGDHLPPPKSTDGIPFVTIGNIDKETRRIDFSDTFMVPRTYFERLKPNRKPRKGDVLYTVTGSFGIPVVVDNGTQFCFQRHIGLVRPKQETLSKWLYYLLLSPQVFGLADDGATGAAQRTVSLKLLRNFLVPTVSRSQQESDIFRLDAIARETERLESNSRSKLNALDEIRQSLLQDAFAGAL
jgi:type I restriction enzyme S subunit